MNRCRICKEQPENFIDGLCYPCFLQREQIRFRRCRGLALQEALEIAKQFDLELPDTFDVPWSHKDKEGCYDNHEYCWICSTPIPDCDCNAPMKCNAPTYTHVHYRCIREYCERRPSDEELVSLFASEMVGRAEGPTSWEWENFDE